ncbi:MAG: TAXI family TRAP transporter solute-binding subunit [Chloroflexi bacterium]|nr:TAXI family TRAP transporter solute-binding subunit [Chloroflexota bacterium]
MTRPGTSGAGASRRKLASVFAATALAALVAGCGGGATAPAPAPSGAQSAPASQPAAKPASQPTAQPAAGLKPAAPAAQPPAQAGSGAAKRLTMGSSAAASSYYAYTVALAKLLQSKLPDVNVTVTEGGGTSLNAKRLVDGNIDFSLASFAGLYPIYAGLDPAWKDNPMKDARTFWVFDPATHVFWVREDSNITSVEQLHGKDFSPGGKGSGTEVIARLLTFPVLGIEPKWLVGGMDDAAAAFKDRRIVGMGKATAVKRPDALIQETMTNTKIRVLGWTPEQVQKVKAKYPFMNTLEVPAGTYKADWNEKPITTWADGIGMYGLAKFDSELAYQFTKHAIEDSKLKTGVQASAYPPMADFDLAITTLDLAPIPLHAGAQKYFAEIGAKIPDHLKSPEAR